MATTLTDDDRNALLGLSGLTGTRAQALVDRLDRELVQALAQRDDARQRAAYMEREYAKKAFRLDAMSSERDAERARREQCEDIIARARSAHRPDCLCIRCVVLDEVKEARTVLTEEHHDDRAD